MGNTLFELVDDMQQLYEMAIDPECDQQMLADTIDGVMGMIEMKAEGYSKVIKQLDMEQKQAEELSKAFAAKAEVRKNNIKRMKEALKTAMEALDTKKIDAGGFSIKLEANGGKAPLIIDGPVPENMTKITIEADNTKIREFLEKQEGQSCEWAHIAPRGTHIVIR